MMANPLRRVGSLALARVVVVVLGCCLATAAVAESFDHQHRAWTALLSQHVVVRPDGTASAVRYAGFQRERGALRQYLDRLGAVSEADFSGWDRNTQLAFLINAYNAFTIALILDRYPDLGSIKDLGSFFQSPWARRFFTLLGQARSLDDIEHRMIREPGRYDEPRIHVALVCASIGCPMLRPEAYVAERLDEQLTDALQRFLSDRRRNRFNAERGQLEVSRLFEWYGDDFTRPGRTLKDVLASHAASLADTPAAVARLRRGEFELAFLPYDWRLNDRFGDAREAAP